MILDVPGHSLTGGQCLAPVSGLSLREKKTTPGRFVLRICCHLTLKDRDRIRVVSCLYECAGQRFFGIMIVWLMRKSVAIVLSGGLCISRLLFRAGLRHSAPKLGSGDGALQLGRARGARFLQVVLARGEVASLHEDIAHTA